ncbi:hypothetical protein NVP1256O_54 [Vibrio phage 1.256.O._10N.286.45.F8]|nr:hypothetical protein NVP1256O_54 [Vibrio phage 1.256.O._10N.286.45.F8]
MSIRKDVDYPGRWNAATTAYPMGEPKNRTTSTSKDGSYLEKKWIGDYEAFFGALLNEAEESPNGTEDTAEASQFFDALTSKVNGETSFSANGYHKTPGGLIIQWGSTSVSGEDVLTVDLPIEYPNQSLIVIATDVNISSLSSGTVAYPLVTYAKSNTQFEVVMKGATGGNWFGWISIGY